VILVLVNTIFLFAFLALLIVLASRIYQYKFGNLENLKKECMGFWNLLFDSFSDQYSSVFVSKDKRPLYKIFYRFNHNTTIDWVNWIKGQKREIQEKAFKQIIDYLEEPFNKQGSISLEAIRALITFNLPQSFDALVEFLKSCKQQWGKYKSLESYYEAASLGLVQINPSMAKEFLNLELNYVKEKHVAENLRRLVIKAISSLPEEITIYEILSDLVLEDDFDINTRKEIISILSRRNSSESYEATKLILEKFSKLAPNSAISLEDVEILRVLFSFLKTYIAENNQEIWFTLLEILHLPALHQQVLSIICEELEKPEFKINENQILNLLELKGLSREKINKALSTRFELNENELTIIKDSSVATKVFTKIKGLNIERSKEKFPVPKVLLDDYRTLETLFKSMGKMNKKTGEYNSGITLITGNAEQDKLYIARAIAANNHNNFVYLNSSSYKNLPLEESTILHKKIMEVEPCVFFVEDFASTLNSFLNSGSATGYVYKLMDLVKKLSREENIFAIVTMNQDQKDLEEEFDIFKEYFQSIPNAAFYKKISINKPTKEKKQMIFSFYENRLKATRNPNKINFDGISGETDILSTSEFLSFLLSYFRTSLLVRGELMPLDEFKNLSVS
jgi:hypothetical protein